MIDPVKYCKDNMSSFQFETNSKENGDKSRDEKLADCEKKADEKPVQIRRKINIELY